MARIGIVQPQPGAYGVGTFGRTLRAYLMAVGHDVRIFAAKSGPVASQSDREIVRTLSKPRQTVHEFVGRLDDEVRQEALDVLVVSLGRGLIPAARELARLPDSVKLLFVAHNSRTDIYEVFARTQGLWNVAVGVGPNVVNQIQARVPDRPVQLIGYGVRLPRDAEVAGRRGWSQPLRLLYVGRINIEQKNVCLLPAILAGCRRRGLDVSLTVVGDGSERPAFEQACVEHGVTDLVEMRGLQPQAAVYAAMREHHVLLLPSNREGQPLVLLESQINGCVPVASRLAGVIDAVVAEGETGELATPGVAEEFVDKIALLQDEAVWRARSAAAMKNADAFSEATMGKKYLRIIEDLLAGKYDLPRPRRDACPPSPWTTVLADNLRGRLSNLGRRIMGRMGQSGSDRRISQPEQSEDGS
jgi:glycosyltransferase involved in cell wall biosynthesis